MKKRLLALLMALCISSLETMGAFASAADDGATTQIAEENEDSIMDTEENGEDESAVSEEPEGDSTALEETVGNSTISVESEGNSAVSEEQKEDSANSIEEEQGDSVPQNVEKPQDEIPSEEVDAVPEEIDEQQNSQTEENADGTASSENAESMGGADSTEGVTGTNGGSSVVEEDKGADSEEAVMSGECGADGDNLTWELSGSESELTLTISGAGQMASYSEEIHAPWSASAGSIRYIVLGEEITSIGDYAFAECSNLEEIEIYESISDIGNNAFLGCSALNTINFAGTKETWAQINHSEIPEGVEVNYGKAEEVAVESVELNKLTALLDPGEQLQLKAYVKPTNATNKNVIWSSTDENVATVSAEGVVTAVSPGNAVINVTTVDGNKTKSCKIQVVLLEGDCGENLTWTVTGTKENSTLTISGSGEMDDYRALSYDGSTAPWHIYYDRIKSVVVEEGVTKIGSYAFNYINLTSIELPESLQTIGGYAFDSCRGLTSIELPEGLQTIGEYAFNGCKGLTSIELPESLHTIGGYAFRGCNGLENVSFSNNLQEIGDYAFYRCPGLKNLEMGAQSIGEYAFSKCSGLTNVKLLEGSKSIGRSAFKECANLTSIELPIGLQTIGDEAFSKCNELTSIKLQEGLQSIGNYAFSGCGKLADIELSEGLESIGNYAFSSCIGVTNIEFPQGLKNIGHHAFSGCSELTDIKLQEGLETIGSDAFENCSNLTSIELPTNFQRINEAAFRNCSGLESIVLPNNLQYIESYAFSGCGNLSNIAIPETVRVISTYAFENCTSLTGIEIPDSVLTLDRYAFYNCTGLTTVKLSGNINHIYASTFEGCESLTSINIPKSVQWIDNSAFSNCSELTGIEFPEELCTIGDRAFFGCNSLSIVFIPRGVTSIGKNVFENCENIETLGFYKTLQRIDESAFINCNSLSKIYYEGTQEDWDTVNKGIFSDSIEVIFGKSSDIPLVNIELNRLEATLFVNEQLQLKVLYSPSNAGNRKVAWESSNTDVAAVDENGSVRAVSAGSAVITAITEEGNKRASCEIVVNDTGFDRGKCGENLFWSISGDNDDLTLTISGLGLMDDYDITGTYATGDPDDSTPWWQYKNRIRTVFIGKDVKSIGNYAFAFCRGLERIDIPGSVSSISSTAFTGCSCVINYWGTSDNWNQIYGTYSGNIKFLSTKFDTSELVLNPVQEKNLHIVSDFGDAYFDDIIWTSSDDDIASVDNEGKVTAKKQGDVVITASLYSVECQLPVSVIVPLTEFRLDQHNVTLLKNETITLESTHEPQDAVIKKIYWQSSNPEIVSIDENGHVTALKGGSADITATVFGSDKTDSCTVTVIVPVSAVGLERDEFYVGQNEEGRLKALVYPEDATNKSVRWTSSDEEVAQIDADGIIHGNNLGTTEITITTEDGSFSATCQVHVVVPVAEIVFDKKSISLLKRQTGKISATALPQDAFDKSITWKSSNTKVVTVDAGGNIKATGAGTAVITATSSNGKTAQCTVNVKLPDFGISYVMNGGINNQNNPKQYNEAKAVVLKAPTRKGYVFGGWYLDAQFTKKATGIAAGQTGNKTFYAKWIGKSYKIVFNGNTANSGKMSRITYTIGKSTTLPANSFVKKEYVFTGWNTRADGKGVTFKNKASLGAYDATNGSTITLYAQWKIKQYSIIYKLNGGTNNKSNPASYNFKSTIKTLAKPTRKGYVFQGWFTDARCKKAFTGIKKGSTGNKTVYAKWKVVKYTVQYVLNRGTAPKGNPTSYYVTTATIKLKNPTRKGFTFLGWYKEPNYKTKIVSITKGSVGNLKLYAKWTPTKYTIKYNLNGGTNNKANPAFYTMASAKIVLSKPTRKGYVFDGWYTDSKFKNRFIAINKGTIGNKTVYAKWKVIKYSISYVLNGGTAPTGNPTSYTITSATITLKNPSRKGYTFAGWYKESGFKTKVTTIAKGSVGNLKLYAKWVATKYKITYNLNGGANNASNPATYTIATANISLAKPTRKGCVFEGWYSDSKFKNKVTTIPKGSTGNKTLYARWKIYEYLISYELNGGRYAIGNPASYNVNTPTITLLDATRSGYVFAGWYKESTFKTRVTKIPRGSAGNLKLYAKWLTPAQHKKEVFKQYVIDNGENCSGGKEIVKSQTYDSFAETLRVRVLSNGYIRFVYEHDVAPNSVYGENYIIVMDYDPSTSGSVPIDTVYVYDDNVFYCRGYAVKKYNSFEITDFYIMQEEKEGNENSRLMVTQMSKLDSARAFSLWNDFVTERTGITVLDIVF